MAEETDETQVTLPDVEEGNFPTPDYSELVGRKVKIAKVTTHKGKVFDGKQSYYVKLQTEIINPEEVDPFNQVRATKILGLSTLIEDGKEKVIWTPKSKMARWLKSKGIDHFNKAVGVEVIIKLTEPNDEGKEFLSF